MAPPSITDPTDLARAHSDAWLVQVVGPSAVSPERMNELVAGGFLEAPVEVAVPVPPPSKSGRQSRPDERGHQQLAMDPWAIALLMGALMAGAAPALAKRMRSWPLSRWLPAIGEEVARRRDEGARETAEVAEAVGTSLPSAPAAPPSQPPAPPAPPSGGGGEPPIPAPPEYLTPQEREAWVQARTRGAEYVRGLGNRVEKDVDAYATREREVWAGEDITQEVDRDQRLATREAIREEVADAVATGQTAEDLASDLGHRTGDWTRDWLRIARTELQAAHNEGVAITAVRDFGPDAQVARIPESGACALCRRLYLDEEGKPRVWTVSRLVDNGTGVGVRAEDKQAGLWPAHPHCFPAGVLVRTSLGPVPIELVSERDLVIGHDGAWHRVTATWSRVYSGDLVVLHGHRWCLASTPDHQHLTVRGWRRADEFSADDPVWFVDDAAGARVVRVVGVERKPFDGMVFNLRVDVAESFIANGIVTHNCRCGTQVVPPGFGFDTNWNMRPQRVSAQEV